MLTLDQALEILTRFHQAAPPTAAAKLNEVMALLRAMNAELTLLRTQAQEAPAAAAAARAAAQRARANGRGGLSVTDQLADIFEMIATGETAKVPDKPAPVQQPSVQSLPEGQPNEDPIAWLREAMPHLLVAEEDQRAGVDRALLHSSKLKTTPIIDLMQPMQNGLRSTITTIRSQSNRLASGGLGSLTTEQMATVRDVRDQADSALSLLDAVQQINALQEGIFRLQRRDFACNDLIARARDMMQAAARARQHRITYYPPDRPLYAHGDFDHALAILIDLLDNAIRYTPKGGASRITTDDLGTHVLISVADNGIGLSESDLQHVGKPFWRATHHPAVRDNPGSGLRLYLAQRVLTLQGGELIFSGELNGGSTFSFSLPAADPPNKL